MDPVRARARMVIMTIHQKPVALDLVMRMANEPALIGSHAYAREALAQVLAG